MEEVEKINETTKVKTATNVTIKSVDNVPPKISSDSMKSSEIKANTTQITNNSVTPSLNTSPISTTKSRIIKLSGNSSSRTNKDIPQGLQQERARPLHSLTRSTSTEGFHRFHGGRSGYNHMNISGDGSMHHPHWRNPSGPGRGGGRFSNGPFRDHFAHGYHPNSGPHHGPFVPHRRSSFSHAPYHARGRSRDRARSRERDIYPRDHLSRDRYDRARGRSRSRSRGRIRENDAERGSIHSNRSSSYDRLSPRRPRSRSPISMRCKTATSSSPERNKDNPKRDAQDTAEDTTKSKPTNDEIVSDTARNIEGSKEKSGSGNDNASSEKELTQTNEIKSLSTKEQSVAKASPRRSSSRSRSPIRDRRNDRDRQRENEIDFDGRHVSKRIPGFVARSPKWHGGRLDDRRGRGFPGSKYEYDFAHHRKDRGVSPGGPGPPGPRHIRGAPDHLGMWNRRPYYNNSHFHQGRGHREYHDKDDWGSHDRPSGRPPDRVRHSFDSSSVDGFRGRHPSHTHPPGEHADVGNTVELQSEANPKVQKDLTNSNSMESKTNQAVNDDKSQVVKTKETKTIPDTIDKKSTIIPSATKNADGPLTVQKPIVQEQEQLYEPNASSCHGVSSTNSPGKQTQATSSSKQEKTDNIAIPALKNSLHIHSDVQLNKLSSSLTENHVSPPTHIQKHISLDVNASSMQDKITQPIKEKNPAFKITRTENDVVSSPCHDGILAKLPEHSCEPSAYSVSSRNYPKPASDAINANEKVQKSSTTFTNTSLKRASTVESNMEEGYLNKNVKRQKTDEVTHNAVNGLVSAPNSRASPTPIANYILPTPPSNRKVNDDGNALMLPKIPNPQPVKREEFEIHTPNSDMSIDSIHQGHEGGITDSHEGSNKSSRRPRLGWGQGLVSASPITPETSSSEAVHMKWGNGSIQSESQSNKEVDVIASNSEIVPSVAEKTMENENNNENENEQHEERLGNILPNPQVLQSSTKINESKNINSTTEVPTHIFSTNVHIGAQINGTSVSVDMTQLTKTSTNFGDHKLPSIESTKQGDNFDTPTMDVHEPMVVCNSTDESTKRPLKESLLASIDSLDLEIANVREQIEKINRDVKKNKQRNSINAMQESQEDLNLDSTLLTHKSKKTSFVKSAVDQNYIDTVGSIFFKNAKRARQALEDLPTSMVMSKFAKTYHSLEDYPFYKINIDRGVAVHNIIENQIRKRKQQHTDYLKKLARNYIDMKKVWRARVKKIERDRKRTKYKHRFKNKSKQLISLGVRDCTVDELLSPKEGSVFVPITTNQSSGQKLNSLASPHQASQSPVTHTMDNSVVEIPKDINGINFEKTNDSKEQEAVESTSTITVESTVEATSHVNLNFSSTTVVRTSSRLTNNSATPLELQSKSEMEKVEMARMQSLADQETRKKRLKNALSTVLPDMFIPVHTMDSAQQTFIRNMNEQGCLADGLTYDPKDRNNAEHFINPWNDLEKCIFIDKFLQFPKHFAKIASYLRNKTTGDVIAFYYRTKTTIDYKALLREQQLRRRNSAGKNTWCCWNLSACAAICIGVKFPRDLAKVLLHPSNFRLQQSAENILNSAGAAAILNSPSSTETNKVGLLVNGNTNAESSPMIDIDAANTNKNSTEGDSETIVEEVKNQADAQAGENIPTSPVVVDLYNQSLPDIAISLEKNPQQPYLVKFTDFLEEISYSTRYYPTIVSVYDRYKEYRQHLEAAHSQSLIGKNIERTNSGDIGKLKIKGKVDQAKNKHQVNDKGESMSSTGVNGNSTAQLTKKELKAQRKQKKLLLSNQPRGMVETINGSAATQVGTPAGRKRTSASPLAVHNPKATASPRNNMDVNLQPVDPSSSKPLSISAKRVNKSSTPSNRRPNTGKSMASSQISSSTTNTLGESDVERLISKPISDSHTNTSLNGSVINATANPGPQGKRVVQKWTENEKADFLQYFSTYGKDWSRLMECIPTKTEAQIKNYYQNYKNRLGLQDILKRRLENSTGVASSSPPAATLAAQRSPQRIQNSEYNHNTARIGTILPKSSKLQVRTGFRSSPTPGLSPKQSEVHEHASSAYTSHNASQIVGTRDVKSNSARTNIINQTSQNSERYLTLMNMQNPLHLLPQFQRQSPTFPHQVQSVPLHHLPQTSQGQGQSKFATSASYNDRHLSPQIQHTNVYNSIPSQLSQQNAAGGPTFAHLNPTSLSANSNLNPLANMSLLKPPSVSSSASKQDSVLSSNDKIRDEPLQNQNSDSRKQFPPPSSTAGSNSSRMMSMALFLNEQESPRESEVFDNTSTHTSMVSPTSHLLIPRSTTATSTIPNISNTSGSNTSTNKMRLMANLLNSTTTPPGHHSPLAPPHFQQRQDQTSTISRPQFDSGRRLNESSGNSAGGETSRQQSMGDAMREYELPPHHDNLIWSQYQQIRYENEAEMLRQAAVEKEILAIKAEEQAARAKAAHAEAVRVAQEARAAQEALARQNAREMIESAENAARIAQAHSMIESAENAARIAQAHSNLLPHHTSLGYAQHSHQQYQSQLHEQQEYRQQQLHSHQSQEHFHPLHHQTMQPHLHRVHQHPHTQGNGNSTQSPRSRNSTSSQQ